MSHPILGNYECIFFDCYGTLVDWETAIVDFMQPLLLSHDAHVLDESILEYYATWESREQQRNGKYRDVLHRVMDCYGGFLGFTPTDEERDGFVEALAKSRPFADTQAALDSLAKEVKLGILSNTDNDLLAETTRPIAIDFDIQITAEDVGVYKPDLGMLNAALASVSAKTKLLMIAQSVYHDITPANSLGIDCVWINRESVYGKSAVPAANATANWTYATLGEFATAVTPN